MKPMTGKELCKLIESHGWNLARVTGSHHIYSKTGSVVRLSVPVHSNKELRTGTLRAIMKQAEIDI